MEFSDNSKAALATILKCMQEAQAAFNRLSDVEQHQCLDFHNEGSSLNHCLRWGEQAADELLEAAGGPPKKWGVLLEMENKKSYLWVGTAEDETAADVRASETAVLHTGKEVLETVRIECLDDYVMALNVPCTEVLNSDGMSDIGLVTPEGTVHASSPLEARKRLEPSDRFNLALITEMLAVATEDALNAGCLTLQTTMGVSDGDVASIHFSGPDEICPVHDALAAYVKVELLRSMKDSD